MTEPLTAAAGQAAMPRKPAEVHSLLEALIARKEQEAAEIEQLVRRYERRMHQEEQARQRMSPFRRMLTGRKPDHHVAVEYIHYVKKPMEKVRRLREEIAEHRAKLAETAASPLSE